MRAITKVELNISEAIEASYHVLRALYRAANLLEVMPASVDLTRHRADIRFRAKLIQDYIDDVVTIRDQLRKEVG